MKCKKCGNKIDCDCMGCHECHPEYTCETCGFCHIDGWEAGECWSLANDHDYDPFSKRDVDFTGVAKKFTEGAQTLKEWKEYAFLLEDKLKLQQQALPVVPECVGEFITKVKKAGNNLTFAFNSKFDECPAKYWNEAIVWRLNHPEEFARAFITGKYEVEKPQLFRLKLKNAVISNYYLWLNQATGKVFVDKKFLDWTNHDNVKNIFTEQEIAKVSDGAFVNNEAFELVPVEDGE